MATDTTNPMLEACARVPHGDAHVELCVRAPDAQTAKSLVLKAAEFFMQPPSPTPETNATARKDGE